MNTLDPEDVNAAISHLDQEWLRVCKWVANSDPDLLEELREACLSDHPEEFIEELRNSEKFVTVAQICILLVINEALLRLHNLKQEDLATEEQP